MKVILIKECKDGKVNDVVDVSAGYATNFLIKNGFAVSMNSKTVGKLNRQIKHNEDVNEENIANALKAKKLIEETVITFSLKQTNNVVHGSITRKQIIKKLEEQKIHVKSVNVENKKIASFGVSNIKIKLYKDIFATLKVTVNDNE